MSWSGPKFKPIGIAQPKGFKPIGKRRYHAKYPLDLPYHERAWYLGGAERLVLLQGGDKWEMFSDYCRDHGCGKWCVHLTGSFDELTRYAVKSSEKYSAEMRSQVTSGVLAAMWGNR